MLLVFLQLLNQVVSGLVIVEPLLLLVVNVLKVLKSSHLVDFRVIWVLFSNNMELKIMVWMQSKVHITLWIRLRLLIRDLAVRELGKLLLLDSFLSQTSLLVMSSSQLEHLLSSL